MVKATADFYFKQREGEKKMPFVYSLCSSSKGNSTYIGNKESGILVDVGIGPRAIVQKLNLNDISLFAVKAIFITHEHTDHVKGLKAIGEKLNVPIYASKETIAELYYKNLLPKNADVFEINKREAQVGDVTVSAFDTPHDSAHSLGYKIRFEDGKTVSVCTDLGYMTDEIYSVLKGSDLVLLESNYDEDMLMFGAYPQFLKRRILSRSGHLSNCDCGDTLINLFNDGTSKFILGHLSESNNRPELALTSAVSALLKAGAEYEKDYILRIAKSSSVGEVVPL